MQDNQPKKLQQLTLRFEKTGVLKIAQPRTRVVHLKRKDGVIVQDCDVYIGRACSEGGWNLPASKWANRFTILQYGSAEECARRYENYVLSRSDLIASLPELRGKTLGCWCAPRRCHGDVLARLANALPQ